MIVFCFYCCAEADWCLFFIRFILAVEVVFLFTCSSISSLNPIFKRGMSFRLKILHKEVRNRSLLSVIFFLFFSFEKK